MRLLVTGAAGQVGRALRQASAGFGFDCVFVARAELAIDKRDAVFAALARFEPTLVINAAAYTQVDAAETEPLRAFAANRDGVANLADYCAAAQIPLIHLSTDYVFDGRAGRPYTETDAVSPLGIYARSKAAGEAELRARLRQHLCLRVAWVFGADAKNFARTVFDKAQSGAALRIVADEWSGPTAATGLAHSLLTLAARYFEQGELKWGTYHYTGAPHCNRYQFAEALLTRAVELGALARLPAIIAVASAEFPALAERPLDSRLDCTRFEQTFGMAVPDWRAHLEPLIEAWRHERA